MSQIELLKELAIKIKNEPKDVAKIRGTLVNAGILDTNANFTRNYSNLERITKMKLEALMDVGKLEQYIQDGFVSKRKHPTLPLWVLNYTAKVQFDWLWDEITLNCRGLIVDENDIVIARPLPKFFSYEQLECKLPNGTFEVQEKMDGSLGIVFDYMGQTVIATRGSFESDQAKRAYDLLPKGWKPLSSLTYLFEIIYKENRVVVDYDYEGLVFLTALNSMGDEYELLMEEFRKPKTYSYEKVEDMLAHADNNLEGFVLKYADGTRVKVKLEEYKRLHRLLTGVSEKTIWEALQVEGGFERLIERVPDEFYNWAHKVHETLNRDYWQDEKNALEIFRNKPDGDRKTVALYFNEFNPRYKGILFHMLDGKDYSNAIWKMNKPKAENIFKVVSENSN